MIYWQTHARTAVKKATIMAQLKIHNVCVAAQRDMNHLRVGRAPGGRASKKANYNACRQSVKPKR